MLKSTCPNAYVHVLIFWRNIRKSIRKNGQWISLENLMRRSDLEHAADQRHNALLLDYGERRPEDEQLGVRRLGVKLLVGVAVEVSLGEEVGDRLCESGLATELWMNRNGGVLANVITLYDKFLLKVVSFGNLNLLHSRLREVKLPFPVTRLLG